jgi:hypothetical protein
VLPVAINAPIWSNGQHESQFCDSPPLLPVHLSLTVRTSPVSVSRESKEQFRRGMSSASDGRLLSHYPYQLLNYVEALYSGRLSSINRTNFTLSRSKRCFRSSLAKSRNRRFTLTIASVSFITATSDVPRLGPKHAAPANCGCVALVSHRDAGLLLVQVLLRVLQGQLECTMRSRFAGWTVFIVRLSVGTSKRLDPCSGF